MEIIGIRAKTRELDLGLELRLEPIVYDKCGCDGGVKTHAIGARVRGIRAELELVLVICLR